MLKSNLEKQKVSLTKRKSQSTLAKNPELCGNGGLFASDRLIIKRGGKLCIKKLTLTIGLRPGEPLRLNLQMLRSVELHTDMQRRRFVGARHEVRIPLCHFGAALAEQPRDICLGIPLGSQVRSESMPQTMETESVLFFGNSLVEFHFVYDIFEVIIHVEKNSANGTRKTRGESTGL